MIRRQFSSNFMDSYEFVVYARARGFNCAKIFTGKRPVNGVCTIPIYKLGYCVPWSLFNCRFLRVPPTEKGFCPYWDCQSKMIAIILQRPSFRAVSFSAIAINETSSKEVTEVGTLDGGEFRTSRHFVRKETVRHSV